MGHQEAPPTVYVPYCLSVLIWDQGSLFCISLLWDQKWSCLSHLPAGEIPIIVNTSGLLQRYQRLWGHEEAANKNSLDLFHLLLCPCSSCLHMLTFPNLCLSHRPFLYHKEGFRHSSGGKESACNAGDPGSIPGSGSSAGEGIGYPFQYPWASLVAQLVKNLPTMWDTWVWTLGWEDPLEKEKATHSCVLAWRIPWTISAMGSQRVGILEKYHPVPAAW